MVLETPVKLYMTAGFFEKKKCFIGKFGHQLFLNFVSNENLLFTIFLPRSHIWGKSGSWDMGQKALD